MLIYHPAFDIHHYIFRILQLLIKLGNETHDIDRMRILDFYLLFPEELNRVRFPKAIKHIKRPLQNPYETIENPNRLFHQLEKYYLTAIKCLAAYNLIDPCLLLEGKIKRTAQDISDSLLKMLEEANARNPGLLGLLSGPFHDIDLYGKSGLKDRTKLLESKYDPS